MPDEGFQHAARIKKPQTSNTIRLGENEEVLASLQDITLLRTKGAHNEVLLNNGITATFSGELPEPPPGFIKCGPDLMVATKEIATINVPEHGEGTVNLINGQKISFGGTLEIKQRHWAILPTGNGQTILNLEKVMLVVSSPQSNTAGQLDTEVYFGHGGNSQATHKFVFSAPTELIEKIKTAVETTLNNPPPQPSAAKA